MPTPQPNSAPPTPVPPPQYQNPTSIPEPPTPIGTTLADAVKILLALTGYAREGIYWSAEDGKFYRNNQGTWIQLKQFAPKKLTPELVEKVKSVTSSPPGSTLFYIHPSNIKELFTRVLS